MNLEEKIVISIIVPIYNAGDRLHDTVGSLLGQTFDRIEIILVDDGSTDCSPEICDYYALKDGRVSVFHINNGGVSKARNYGMSKAKGRYIMFCDSDDIPEKNWCEKLLNNVNDSVMPICGFNNVRNGNKTTMIEKNLCETIYQVDDFPIVRAWAPWRGIFDSDIIRANNLVFDEQLSYAEDLLFVLSYLKILGGFRVLDDTLYNYYIFENSLSHKKYIADYDKAIRKYMDQCKEMSQRWDNEQKQKYYAVFFDWFSAVLRNTMCNPVFSYHQKIAFNNQIIRSGEFSICLPYADRRNYTGIYISLLKSRQYLLIELLIFLSNAKNKLFH